MERTSRYELAPLFEAVEAALVQNREVMNVSDAINGNHGDHMVDIFETARQAADEKRAAGLAETMDYAATLLEAKNDNGSAQVYARGLRHFAEQFRRFQVDVDDLVGYVQKSLREDEQETAAQAMKDGQQGSDGRSKPASGDVLKALVNGLAGWGQDVKSPEGNDPANYKLNMGALFEFGMAYMQAKQRGGEKTETLADAAATISPLSLQPHRYQSARLALETLLRAMQTV